MFDEVEFFEFVGYFEYFFWFCVYFSNVDQVVVKFCWVNDDCVLFYYFGFFQGFDFFFYGCFVYFKYFGYFGEWCLGIFGEYFKYDFVFFV